MKRFNVFLVLIIASLFLVSCAKKPSKIISPAMKLDLVSGEDKGIFAFSGGIKNENSDVVFTDIKGTLNIMNPKGKKVIYSTPFVIPGIMPFDTGKIVLEKEEKKNILIALAVLFNIKEKLENTGSATSTFIEDPFLKLTGLTYKKENIIDFLKKRMKKHKDALLKKDVKTIDAKKKDTIKKEK